MFIWKNTQDSLVYQWDGSEVERLLMEAILLKVGYVLWVFNSYKLSLPALHVVRYRSKINIGTNCFTKLECQFNRCENSILARKKSRKNSIFASSKQYFCNLEITSVFMDLQMLKLRAKINSIDPGLFY